MRDDDTAPAALEAGSEVVGHRIEKLLGSGGFGGVYAAIDLALDRPVALKVLRRADALHLARFRDEAKLLARLNDPHVIQVYQVGQLPTGEPYLSMERFGDGSLGDLVARGQPAPLEFTVRVVGQVLRGLVAAHGAGIVHRDIKEANILVDSSVGLAKLCDFGIARAREGDREVHTGDMIVGTPHYVAPERFRGVQDDPRSDLYSVGVVFYRLLTGRRPFETPGANALVIARRAATEDVHAPPDVPRAVARVCVELLARDADLRPPTAQAALDALARAWGSDPTASVAGLNAFERAPVGVPLLDEPTRPPGRRVLLGAGGLLVLVAGVAVWWQSHSGRPASGAPASEAPASEAPVSVAPASAAPVSVIPANVAPVSVAPATVAPATVAPATEAPATEAPASEAPASVPPATVASKQRRPARPPVRPPEAAPASDEPAWKKSRDALSPRVGDNPIVTPGGAGTGIVTPGGP
jgi:hypothetical protein